MSARIWATAALAAAVSGATARAQSIAQRVNAVRDGTVDLSFAARPGVCGDGNGSVWIHGNDRVADSRGRICVEGPVHVRLSRSAGSTVSIRACIACRRSTSDDNEVDLSGISPVEAAKYLLTIARETGARNAGEALSAAAFADAGDLTSDFGQLVRDDAAMLETRKQALFWLGQQDGSTRELIGLYDTLAPVSLREHFTFVLSQRHDDLAIDKLIDVARRDPDVHVRKQAMFWLGQSKDPKALQFFRDILTR